MAEINKEFAERDWVGLRWEDQSREAGDHKEARGWRKTAAYAGAAVAAIWTAKEGIEYLATGLNNSQLNDVALPAAVSAATLGIGKLVYDDAAEACHHATRPRAQEHCGHHDYGLRARMAAYAAALAASAYQGIETLDLVKGDFSENAFILPAAVALERVGLRVYKSLRNR